MAKCGAGPPVPIEVTKKLKIGDFVLIQGQTGFWSVLNGKVGEIIEVGFVTGHMLYYGQNHTRRLKIRFHGPGVLHRFWRHTWLIDSPENLREATALELLARQA